MKLNIKRFSADERGAVTVDWVVLTAAVVVLAVGLLEGIHVSTRTVRNSIADEINTVEVKP